MKKTAAVLLTVLALAASMHSLAEAMLPEDLSEGSRLAGLLITREDLSAYTGEAGALSASCVQAAPDADPEYVFEGVSGFRLICFTIPDEAGDGSRIVSNVDDGFTSIDFDINENGRSVKVDAVISFVPGREDACFFYNPVLISNSGRVFAVPGDFMAVSAAMNPPGSSVGQTIRDERRHTENGMETTDSTAFTVQINAVREPAEIRLLQFSEQHEILKNEAFAPGAVPDEIVPLAEADYLLLETVEKDGDEMRFTRRVAVGRDTDFLNTLSCRDDGICVSHYHDVLWK